ncbi:MAG: hypothetical protein C4519_11060 [Desulfobacteraceae bacterium]|nr:MAG: hypothetical protein C4519_11060 [Desulfobacteraceae bacterium]
MKGSGVRSESNPQLCRFQAPAAAILLVPKLQAWEPRSWKLQAHCRWKAAELGTPRKKAGLGNSGCGEREPGLGNRLSGQRQPWAGEPAERGFLTNLSRLMNAKVKND